eukprot:4906903-Pleurochrysis_carterae.AAC.1
MSPVFNIGNMSRRSTLVVLALVPSVLTRLAHVAIQPTVTTSFLAISVLIMVLFSFPMKHGLLLCEELTAQNFEDWAAIKRALPTSC